MPDYEFEFNQQDRDLILSQVNAEFSDTDYIRLTIYLTEAINNIVDLPDDTKGIDGKAIFFSTNNDSMDINISPFKDGMFSQDDILSIGGDLNDFKIYQTLDDGEPLDNSSIYIKPNEIFNEFELPQGNYRIQIDFLNQVNPSSINPTADTGDVEDDSGGDVEIQQQFYQFVIKEVSTSRKEVRLKLLDRNIVKDSNIISDLTNEFNQGTDTYQFKHVLNIG